MASVCTDCFTKAEPGIVDGRMATTIPDDTVSEALKSTKMLLVKNLKVDQIKLMS